MNCCNEFWWCLQNVAKGIWRDELPYAKLMYVHTPRASLDMMVSWWIGIQHNYQVSSGKMGKYFKRYLPELYWEKYKQTYSDGEYDHMWDSVFIACELFQILAIDVAEYSKFTYPIHDDVNMTEYLKHVRKLPIDTKEIF